MDENRKQQIRDLLHNPIFNINDPTDDALQLYNQALTHSSYANEMKQVGANCEDYEKLEFLGNYILNCVLAFEVFTLFPGRQNDLRVNYPDKSDEGLLSGQIDYLKSDEYISDLVQVSKIGIDDIILVAKKRSIEESIRASVFEAVVGAFYLDKKFEKTHEFLLRFYDNSIRHAEPISDFWGELQIIVSRISRAKEVDKLIETNHNQEGPAHQPIHYIDISVPTVKGCEKLKGSGQSNDKKKAKQKAAKNAIRNYFDKEY